MNSALRKVGGVFQQLAKKPAFNSINSLRFREFQRFYRHWAPVTAHDFGLPVDSMPFDMDAVFKKNPKEHDLYENYWYWKLRGDSTILDAENLPKKSYKQLARDLGLSVIHEPTEHFVGMLELYEYLKAAPFVGPFGTIENPVLIPSVNNERLVACTGGTGDNEHAPVWFRCREGFLYRCGECDQIFMLVRVDYWDEDNGELFPVDADVQDTFDGELIKKMQKKWNNDMVLWAEGQSYVDDFSKIHDAMDRGEISFDDVAATVKVIGDDRLSLEKIKKKVGLITGKN